jgi:CheY-like chemotaxis protein
MDARILVADNDDGKLNARCALLRAAGYEVFPRGTVASARAFFESTWVHTAVIDKQMESEEAESDKSGIELCQDVDDIAPIPKIIITAYPKNHSHVRAALRTTRIVDFVPEEDGPDALLEAVAKALDDDLQLNWQLPIVFAGGTTFVGMASVIAGAPEGDPRLLDLAPEIGDLFRMLFHDCQEIGIYQLQPGHHGTVLVWVQRFAAHGELFPVIVKCGPRDVIRREKQNHAAFVKDLVGPFSAQLERNRETLHFGGLVYQVVGVQLEQTTRFADFYRRSDPAAVTHAIDRIFSESCRKWYEQGSSLSDDRIDRLYRAQLGLDRPDVAQRLDAEIRRIADGAGQIGLRAIEGEGDRLRFRFSEKDEAVFPMPHRWADGQAGRFPSAVPLGITHGDLNGSNILLDRDGRAWLIDFERTGLGPVLRDFVELEGVIRWELTSDRNFERLYRFEKALLDPDTIDGLRTKALPPGISEDLTKAWAAIAELRLQAVELVAGADARQYRIGLLFHALRMITFSGFTSPGQARPSLARRAHALLSAAMVCYRLEHWDDWRGWPGDPEAGGADRSGASE